MTTGEGDIRAACAKAGVDPVPGAWVPLTEWAMLLGQQMTQDTHPTIEQMLETLEALELDVMGPDDIDTLWTARAKFEDDGWLSSALDEALRRMWFKYSKGA